MQTRIQSLFTCLVRRENRKQGARSVMGRGEGKKRLADFVSIWQPVLNEKYMQP